jgi:hypothetical protein
MTFRYNAINQLDAIQTEDCETSILVFWCFIQAYLGRNENNKITGNSLDSEQTISLSKTTSA